MIGWPRIRTLIVARCSFWCTKERPRVELLLVKQQPAEIYLYGKKLRAFVGDEAQVKSNQSFIGMLL